MTDLERVIMGLSRHGNSDCEYNEETMCPYWGENHCSSHLCLDALDLLKKQEPRVMTIGDLYGNDMGYYERKDEELVWPVLIARGGPDSDGTVGLVRKDAFEIMADCDLINQTWRIWTAYPTKEQREGMPWT